MPELAERRIANDQPIEIQQEVQKQQLGVEPTGLPQTIVDPTKVQVLPEEHGPTEQPVTIVELASEQGATGQPITVQQEVQQEPWGVEPTG